MAQSSTRRVYVPQDMNVTLPASRENPGGRVVQLRAGYCDLDEACQAHPVLSRLRTVDPDEYDRQEKLRAAQQEHDEAVSKADQKLGEARAKIDEDRRKSVQRASEEYAERREKALASGEGFNEPHPDLETQRAMALTAPAAAHATTPPGSFSLTQTVSDRNAERTARESMPTEEENRRTMEEAQQGGDKKTITRR